MIGDTSAGRALPCPDCGDELVVPETGEEAAADTKPIRLTKHSATDDEVDMTPMIDCVFQLLIFFMVTASYSLQKAIETPTPDQQQSAAQARTVTELENDDDYVIVRIAKDDTIWVDEQEAPSRQEVLAKLREAREGPPGSSTAGPTSLLVMADGDARHETVVMALDAGNAVGMENVRLATVDEDEF
jgi:biopolymer transport protein ExbD